MNKAVFIFLMALLTVGGCKEEPIDISTPGGGNTTLPDGRIRFTLTTNAPPAVAPVTRAGTADEDGMATGNFWVFVFDETQADPILLQIAQAEPAASTTSGVYKWIVQLNSYSHKVRLVLLANSPATVYDATGNSSRSISDEASWGFTPNITKYSEVESALYTASLAEQEIKVPYASVVDPRPLIPQCAIYSFDELSTSTSLGEESAPLDMYRIAAKITVENKTPEAVMNDALRPDFRIVGVNLHNAPANSCLLPRTAIPGKVSPTRYEGDTEATRTTAIAMANDNTGRSTSANPLYLYEANEADAAGLFLILQASYNGINCYYKLTLNSPDVKTIERNSLYDLIINQATGAGYSTYTEAVTAPESNKLKWTTRVTDIRSHDIIDNGQYYIAVSNSEFHLSVFGKQDGISIATFNYPAVQGVSAPTLEVANVVPAGSVSGVSVPDMAPATDTDIKLDFSSQFQSCDVRIKYGNLIKTIVVKRKYMKPYAAQIDDYYNRPEFVYAKVEDDRMDWIGLTSKNDIKAPVANEVINDGGGICINIKQNINKTGTDYRYATLYLSRSNHEGRLKVLLQQDFLNTDDIDDKEDGNIDFTPVVGAFWKKDQTGERLIRIERPESGSMDGYWYATVIEYDQRWNADNGDGIVMDLTPPKDPNVGWLPGADETKVIDGNHSSFESLYQVNTSDVVQGYVTGAGSKGIYFRIGLQKKYNPTVAHPARYAVILLVYTYTRNEVMTMRRQRIFIRQGEDPDYLYRPNEPEIAVKQRPLAAKWSPYNLTDPSGQNNRVMTFSSRTERNGQVAFRGARFVDYPSQGGYFFSFNSRYAFNPRVQVDRSTTTPNFLTHLHNDLDQERDWDENNDEVCPPGYRTPRDISNGYYIGGDFGMVATSEIRQSLFENPVDGDRPDPLNTEAPQNQVSDGEGTVVGVYADGFMDRRQLYTPIDVFSFSTRKNSVVSPYNEKAAFLGRLLFNPKTFASIYFPYSGSMAPNDGAWGEDGAKGNAPYYVGEHAVYGTSTNRKSTTWYLNGYNMLYIGFAEGKSYIPTLVAVAPFSNFSLANIRCVKE